MIARIPSEFGTIAGDFSFYLIAKFNPLDTNMLSTILENGITGQVDPNFAMYVRSGALKVFVMSNGGAIVQLVTSQVPLGTDITIGVTRQNGICNLGVDGTVVVTMPCANSAISPGPSSNNEWTKFGVGAQKESATSCAQKINAFSSTVGYTYSIKLIGGDSDCSSFLGLKMINNLIPYRCRHVQVLPCWFLRRCLPTFMCLKHRVMDIVT